MSTESRLSFKCQRRQHPSCRLASCPCRCHSREALDRARDARHAEAMLEAYFRSPESYGHADRLATR